MFGYDSRITKYTAGAVNQNSILSHSKDLLFALSRERDLNRPLVFIAHSLGGIVVKEMLARSSSSIETELKNIVESTAMVFFLGTPHRGSQDVAALGEVVRSVVSSFGMETTPIILDALGLKTTDLERAQEDFSKLWQQYDFQVKTFQEGLNLTKLGKKAVPDYSSLIGDYREHAETLQANHLEMCRYSGIDDPNYHKVAGELISIYNSIARLKRTEAHPSRRTQRLPGSALSASSSKEPYHTGNGSQVNETCLGSLWFPAINIRLQSLERPVDQTCAWLFGHELYQDWFNSRNRENSYGLLWLKGKPGAGKSTLMKEAFRRATVGQVESNYCTAAFFFSAKGDELEHSCLGLFQSLLYQLLPGDRQYLQLFQEKCHDKNSFFQGDIGKKKIVWAESELESFLNSMLMSQTRRRTVIFVDALDECDESKIRRMAYFWRGITKSAYDLGIDLNVCISSRHFPTITLSHCPKIIVEQHNSDDIATYVDHKFRLSITTQVPQWEFLKESILGKSAGVFLWVVLVVEDVLQSWDDGNGMPYLIKRVMDVPEKLETLFSNMFSSLRPETRDLTVRLFQWAILATKPLRLHEWHHIMAFIRQPALGSLSEWRQSANFTESDEQLEKQIRSVSRGLVEVKKVGAGDSRDEGVEVISIYAGAGSLDMEHGATRIVQVIHESVRDFFLGSYGFSVLDRSLRSHPIGKGHLSIMMTCLDYLNITELDALVEARIHAARRKGSRKVLGSQAKGACSPSSSPYDGVEVYQDIMPDKKENRPPHGKQSVTREEKTSVFEMLRLLDYTPGMDIVEWMTKGDYISAGRTYPDEFLCESVTRSSSISRSRMLEDYPALLSYATFKLFTHARLAETDEADPRLFIKRLEDGTTWARWVALREDIPEGTRMRLYMSDMGLRSWAMSFYGGSSSEGFYFGKSPIDSGSEWVDPIQYTPGEEKPLDIRPSKKGSFRYGPYDSPGEEKSFDIRHPKKPHHRSQSVASFSSAGSHGV